MKIGGFAPINFGTSTEMHWKSEKDKQGFLLTKCLNSMILFHKGILE